MKPELLKKEVKRLRKLKEECEVYKAEAQQKLDTIQQNLRHVEREIRELISECSVKSGQKHAGGGGGLGGYIWVECSGCGEKHFWDPKNPSSVAEWKAILGEVIYHSTGN